MSGIGSILGGLSSLLGGQVAEKEQQVPAQANSLAAGIPDGLSAEQAQQLINTQTPAAPAANLSPQQIAQAAVLAQGVQVPGSEQVIQTPNPAQAKAQAQIALQQNPQANQIILDTIREDLRRENGGTLNTQINSLGELLKADSSLLRELGKQIAPKEPDIKAEKLLTNTVLQTLNELVRKYLSAVQNNEPQAELERKRPVAYAAIDLLKQVAETHRDSTNLSVAQSAIEKLLNIAVQGAEPMDSEAYQSAAKDLASKALTVITGLKVSNPQALVDTFTQESHLLSGRWSKTFDFIQQGLNTLVTELVKTPDVGNRLLHNVRVSFQRRWYYNNSELALLKVLKSAIENAPQGVLDSKLVQEVLKCLDKAIQRAQAELN